MHRILWPSLLPVPSKLRQQTYTCTIDLAGRVCFTSLSLAKCGPIVNGMEAMTTDLLSHFPLFLLPPPFNPLPIWLSILICVILSLLLHFTVHSPRINFLGSWRWARDKRFIILRLCVTKDYIKMAQKTANTSYLLWSWIQSSFWIRI